MATQDCSDADPVEIERGRRFGAWLRGAFERTRLSQRALAEKAGLSASSVSVYLNDCCDKQTGKVRRPEEATIENLANALGIDPEPGRIAAGYAPRVASGQGRVVTPEVGDTWVFRGKRIVMTPLLLDFLEANARFFEKQQAILSLEGSEISLLEAGTQNEQNPPGRSVNGKQR